MSVNLRSRSPSPEFRAGYYSPPPPHPSSHEPSPRITPTISSGSDNLNEFVEDLVRYDIRFLSSSGLGARDEAVAPIPERQSIEKIFLPLFTTAYFNEIMRNDRSLTSIAAKISCIIYPLFCSLTFFADLILFSPEKSDLEARFKTNQPPITRGYYTLIKSNEKNLKTTVAKISRFVFPIFCTLAFSKDLFSAIVEKYNKVAPKTQHARANPQISPDDSNQNSSDSDSGYNGSISGPITPEACDDHNNSLALEPEYNSPKLLDLNDSVDEDRLLGNLPAPKPATEEHKENFAYPSPIFQKYLGHKH